MKAKQNAIALATGIAIGISTAGPMAQAAECWLKATPSTQKFYVDGRQVQLEAYEIGGYNYIKLRNMGKAVGFEVDYDANTNSVLIGSRAEQTDYASQADPSLFTSVLTREVYKGVRDSMAHREEIIAGIREPLPIVGITDPNSLTSLGVAIGMWPSYQFKRNADGEVVCLPKYATAWQAAADHCRPFINSLIGLSDREKVKQMDFYVCDRMTYAVKNASIGDILSQDGVVPSYCANYSYCFKFLCDMAGIPCILVHSDTHMWNEVYVEGQWWSVDVTADDCGDEVALRGRNGAEEG